MAIENLLKRICFDWIQELQSTSQMDDIKNLLENKDLDFNYINGWCKRLNLQTFNLL